VTYYSYPDLGEGYDLSGYEYACCSDCSCDDLEDDLENPEFYCDMSPSEPPYECRSRTEMSLGIDRDGSSIKCSIMAAAESLDNEYACYFSYTMNDNVRIYVDNPPEGFSTIGRAIYEGEEEYKNYETAALLCYNNNPDAEPGTDFYPLCYTCNYDETDENGRIYFNCPVGATGRINDVEEGETSQMMRVEMSVSYGDTVFNEVIDGVGEVRVIKEKSYNLMQYEAQRDEIVATLDALKLVRGIVWGVVIAAAVICIALGIACAIPGGQGACPALNVCLIYGTCIEISLIGMLVGLYGQIEALENQLANINDMTIHGTGDEYKQESISIGYIVAGALLEIAALICSAITGAIADSAGGAGAGTGGGGGFPTMPHTYIV
jgi:hypothetical protein